MPTAMIDGIATHYEVLGSGPPLLMFSPGGFDARLEKWTTLGKYAELKLLSHLPERYRCIIFDRRESGESGGKVERITWDHYAEQGRGLLEHLEVDRAHMMGGCMGCGPVQALAVANPEVVMSMILYWPVGGARYRIRGRARFAEHLAYVRENDLGAVISLARSHDKNFAEDPRVGPWVSVMRRDEGFAETYAAMDTHEYLQLVGDISRGLHDRDTAPGAQPEDLFDVDLPALIVPGQDTSHPTSAARYLEECLSGAEYWDAPVAEQTEQATSARILDFLASVSEAL